MRPGKKPDPMKGYYDRKLSRDPQVKRWVQRILADPEARVDDVDEATRRFIFAQVEQRRNGDFDLSRWEKAMIETCPIIGAPDLSEEDRAGDVELMFRLPELQTFWESWQGLRKQGGRKPQYAAAKAVMCVWGMAGLTPHVEEAYERLNSDARMRSIFEKLEGASLLHTPKRKGERLEPKLPHYSNICRLMAEHLVVGDRCRWQAMKACVECVKAIHALHPNSKRRLLIDGSAIEAWAPQYQYDRDADREEELKRASRTPEAGFRCYAYNGHKQDIDAADLVPVGLKARKTKAWRGYFLVVISDQATGLPLVWTLFDARIDEATAIVPLLSDLHKLWPDLDAELIAGDSAFSENQWCRLCEVDYGIAPVFRLKPSEQKLQKTIPLKDGESRNDTIQAITYRGELVCSTHGKPLKFEGADPGCLRSRFTDKGEKLKPGRSSDERKFVVRGICEHRTRGTLPCGRPVLQMKVNWHRLTRYPHHNNGDPKRYVIRMAMLARLNQAEGIFNRLKNGLLLGGAGHSRNRVLGRAELEGVYSLGLLSMAALALADQRIQHGIEVPPLAPKAPVIPLPDLGEGVAAEEAA